MISNDSTKGISSPLPPGSAFCYSCGLASLALRGTEGFRGTFRFPFPLPLGSPKKLNKYVD